MSLGTLLSRSSGRATIPPILGRLETACADWHKTHQGGQEPAYILLSFSELMSYARYLERQWKESGQTYVTGSPVTLCYYGTPILCARAETVEGWEGGISLLEEKS